MGERGLCRQSCTIGRSEFILHELETAYANNIPIIGVKPPDVQTLPRVPTNTLLVSLTGIEIRS